jgi:tRNA threonylcarbamoyladenosine biosynthesis protein TsaE
MSVLIDITQDELTPFAEQFLVSLNKRNDATVIALSGDLGAGKTTFTQVLAKLLGVENTVQSPTFVVMKRYETKHQLFKNLIHIDAYRLSGGNELELLGFGEWKNNPENIIVIEWPELVADKVTPTEHLRFEHTNQENVREIKHKRNLR